MDRRDEPEGERILCFDAKTGKSLWVHAYDCPYRKLGYPLGPRASVTVQDGQAFALGAMGQLHALDAASGEVLWAKDLDEAYGIQRIYWGVSPSPLVWNDKVIVHFGGSDGACVAAFDRKNGRECWKAVDDRPAYSSPVIILLDGRRILLCWTERYINALDPETGKILWQEAYRLAKRGARMNVATPVVDGGLLFLCSQYEGASVYRLRGADREPEFLWQRGGPSDRKAGINPPITTALFEKGYAYGPELDGEFRCLDAKTGDTVWASSEVTPPGRWSTVHIVKNGERCWIFNEAGELIIAELSREGFKEFSRAKLIEPTHEINRRKVCWAHPAFAGRCVFARNDRELVCAYLGKE
jgi:outer membrane protein assembly factor BamB